MDKYECTINKPKLHFIHSLDYKNTGDWIASPFNYFADYFINRYVVMYHHINLIKWKTIQPEDAIILGGGGLFDNNDNWQRDINRMSDVCGCVIAWSVGFHQYKDFPPPEKRIDYSKLALLSVRDYQNPDGIEYVPCVTCMLPQLKNKADIKRKIGIINHPVYAITGTPYDTIDNVCSVDEITKFISESEAILTTSYHAAYWSMLMGKKTIIGMSWANKFEMFGRKPVILEELSVESLNNAIENWDTTLTDGWLDECISYNINFFNKVKKHLEAYIPAGVDNYSKTLTEMLVQQAWMPVPLFEQMNTTVVESNKLINDIVNVLGTLENKCNSLENELNILKNRIK